MKYKVIITSKEGNQINEKEFDTKVDANNFFMKLDEHENAQKIENEIITNDGSDEEFLIVTLNFTVPIALKYCKTTVKI